MNEEMKKLLFTICTILATMNIFGNSNATTMPHESEWKTTKNILVKVSDVVDDFCDATNTVRHGLSIYCRYGGKALTPAICSINKVTSIVCSGNEVIRLSIEGEYADAFLNAIDLADTVFDLRKISKGEYQLVPTNMTPRSEWLDW